MFLRNIVSYILIACLVTGCVFIINNHIPSELKTQQLKCEKFEPPTLPSFPKVVRLTKEQLSNKDASDTALVNNINEFKQWGIEAQLLYDKAIEEHRRTCQYK